MLAAGFRERNLNFCREALDSSQPPGGLSVALGEPEKYAT